MRCSIIPRCSPLALAAVLALRSPPAHRSEPAAAAVDAPIRCRRRKPQEASPQRTRASCTPTSRAGYYERGQMDVALEELDECGEARSELREGLQHLRPRLFGARRRPARPSRAFSRRSRSRRSDSEIRQNWGWYLCTARTRARSAPRVRSGCAQSVVQDAGNSAGQRRHAARGIATATAAPRTAFFRCGA